MENYKTKIEKIIDEEFNHELEVGIFYYILQRGIEGVQNITEEEIRIMEDYHLLENGFLKCAIRICKECEWTEIIDYIRLHLNCSLIADKK